MHMSHADARAALRALPVELPSWGFGNAGTRFGVFPEKGVARDVFEKIEDAATAHRPMGASPTVALHIPWDLPPQGMDWASLARFAEDLGVRLGAINPNLFQEHEYMLGSACHPDPRVRQKAAAHLKECAEIAGIV